MVVLRGYPLELENREWLRATAKPAELLLAGELPDRVDPRNHPLHGSGFLRVENQGQIGSCQGNSLSDCAEYAFAVATGTVVQISRMYAYLQSQKENNIRGDNGSTLEGGTKAAAKGLCREDIAPYPPAYPGWGWVTQAMVDDAQKYKLMSHVEMTSSDHILQFLGSGIGIVQIGIAWGNDMNPDRYGCIRRFSGAGGGGHAITFAGYVPDDDIKQKSTKGKWLLLKNSWGSNWGAGGYAYVDTACADQMLRSKFTSMYGRSDMETPAPRKLPVDFTKETIFG